MFDGASSDLTAAQGGTGRLGLDRTLTGCQVGVQGVVVERERCAFVMQWDWDLHGHAYPSKLLK